MSLTVEMPSGIMIGMTMLATRRRGQRAKAKQRDSPCQPFYLAAFSKGQKTFKALFSLNKMNIFASLYRDGVCTGTEADVAGLS